jgi:2-C-methyl-D-erythritol 4-phosphate cytidylyltransferase
MAAAIIVAAGKGRRMAGRVPKQYLSLRGCPVVGRTLKVFDACPQVDALILVVPQSDFEYCRSTVFDRLDLRKSVLLAAGGAQRQDSVYNGLLRAAEVLESTQGLVAIHDGVRPLVAVEQVSACIRRAREHGGCILGLPALDTPKQVDGHGKITATLNREMVWMAQTPQVFRHDLILSAHSDARACGFAATDDAQLMERMGFPVAIISGSRRNIKITTAEDLAMAEAWLERGATGKGME